MKTLPDSLQQAQRNRVALGHFNFSEFTALQAIVAAARELNVPVVVGVSEGERDFLGVRQAAALVNSYRDEFSHPIFLNADHTHSLARAEEAARAGFDMIVFDRSSLPLEENIAETKAAVEAVKSINPAILVEGEVGYIGTSSEILDKTPEGLALTTPEEARQFVAATRVDLFSPAVGNMHGMLASMVAGNTRKRLDIPRIAAIKETTSAFLTLHGGSGTDDDDFRQAIRAGINMIHINTELRVAWRRALESALALKTNDVAPYKLLPPVIDAVKQVVRARLLLFNSTAANRSATAS
jgi:fructose-bisphosphate aldolase, class II